MIKCPICGRDMKICGASQRGCLTKPPIACWYSGKTSCSKCKHHDESGSSMCPADAREHLAAVGVSIAPDGTPLGIGWDD